MEVQSGMTGSDFVYPILYTCNMTFNSTQCIINISAWNITKQQLLRYFVLQLCFTIPRTHPAIYPSLDVFGNLFPFLFILLWNRSNTRTIVLPTLMHNMLSTCWISCIWKITQHGTLCLLSQKWCRTMSITDDGMYPHDTNLLYHNPCTISIIKRTRTIIV